MFARLYQAMRDIGLPNPREVDELYLWECAALLGVGDPEKPMTDGSGRPTGADKYDYMRRDLAYQEARAAWQADPENNPAPDPSLHYQWEAEPEPDGGALLASVLESGSSLS